ncbi:MAG: hypothetical protein JXA69_10155 [Phycisphaerae bacterium]|nr:hypothetical protein [Phycisphaerae bacterium]
MVPRYHLGLILIGVTSMAARAADEAAPIASRPAADEATFRRGLQQRGLFELLDLHDQQHPPQDEVDHALRRRDAFLRTSDDAMRPLAERRQAVRAAAEVLEELLAEHPEHPERFRWQRDLGADLVERFAADAVEAVLFRVASPAQREDVVTTSARAIDVFEQLMREIQAEWQRVGSLAPHDFEALSGARRLTELEAIEASAAYLLAWARLYRAMTLPADDADRVALLAAVNDEVVTRRRWTTQPHAATGLQVQSLVLAGLANRLAGKLDEADPLTELAIRVYTRLDDPTLQRTLDRWALLAVLERIRLLRDRDRPTEAIDAVKRAYTWVAKTRPDDAGAVVSLAILERGMQPPAPADDPLLALARKNPAVRPMIYESVGRLVRQQATRDTANSLDQLGLAWVLSDDPADADQAAQLARTVASTAEDSFLRAEALYVLARCETHRGRATAAADALLELAQNHASSARATAALDDAVRLAAEGITRETAGRQAARDTFVRSVRTLRERSPDDPRVPALTFAAGVALQQLERWPEAAAEFAQVPASDAQAPEAALRRARCLAKLFERQPDVANANAAVEAAAQAQQRNDDVPNATANVCAAAEAALLRAGIQADLQIGRFRDAVETLADFEKRYAACPEWVGSMWRIRLTAMEALGRLAEANALITHVLEAEPAQAGPVMRGLFARMRERIEALRDEGNTDGVRKLAGDAASLAEHLERWTAQHAPHQTAQVRWLRAMVLLDADRVDAARQLADNESADEPRWLFVRAECIYRQKAYRDALPLFNRVWRATEEASELWWQALLRSLQCHTEIGTEPGQILESIDQHRHRYPTMGGKAFLREFDALEKRHRNR